MHGGVDQSSKAHTQNETSVRKGAHGPKVRGELQSRKRHWLTAAVLWSSSKSHSGINSGSLQCSWRVPRCIDSRIHPYAAPARDAGAVPVQTLSVCRAGTNGASSRTSAASQQEHRAGSSVVSVNTASYRFDGAQKAKARDVHVIKAAGVSNREHINPEAGRRGVGGAAVKLATRRAAVLTRCRGRDTRSY